MLGIEHKLLVFGASPDWSYSDIRGFGASLPPWLAFKAYWVAWAVLLAVLARLAWVRGRESDAGARLKLARARLTRPTAITAALAGIAVLGLGAGIFYNTNVLNRYQSHDARLANKAAYERLYARYADVPQPRVTASNMHVELHPERRAADFRGSYRLVNPTTQAIDTVHVATATGAGVDTRSLGFDRPATRVLDDAVLGHRIYKLATPLRPGESMQLDYEVRFAPRGFGNRRRGRRPSSTTAAGSVPRAFLPAIGYQPARELREAGDRLTQGLPARPLVPVLEDLEARKAVPGDVGIQFEAIVGTAEDQMAIAPGVLRRSWRENGRRYFHYASNAPIRERRAVLLRQLRGASRAVQRRGCRSVPPPDARQRRRRPWRAARAPSLELYTRLFGPYPHRTLRIVENAERGIGAHSEPSLVDYGDGFALLNPARRARGPRPGVRRHRA